MKYPSSNYCESTVPPTVLWRLSRMYGQSTTEGNEHVLEAELHCILNVLPPPESKQRQTVADVTSAGFTRFIDGEVLVWARFSPSACGRKRKGSRQVFVITSMVTDETRTAGRSFGRRAYSASFLPSVTLCRLASFKYARAAKARRKATSTYWGLGIRKRQPVILN